MSTEKYQQKSATFQLGIDSYYGEWTQEKIDLALVDCMYPDFFYSGRKAAEEKNTIYTMQDRDNGMTIKLKRCGGRKAKDGAHGVKRINVSLDEQTVVKAKIIGNGIMSEGLRIAVKNHGYKLP